ncbi:MAG: DNA-binding protein [Rhodospirillaceae bacterium]|nr:DNA-binding protein [Rhodospirillaceae bacterium]
MTAPATRIRNATTTAASGSRQRRCIASGRRFDPAQLVRFVLSPDGAVLADVGGRLPGRGMWLEARREAVELALSKQSFARAAKRQVQVEPDLADRVEGLLAGRCLEGLGLARRAGQAVTGFERVRVALQTSEVAILLAAADAAADGRRKLTALARAMIGGCPEVALFSRSELSLALGRENVVHAALLPGGLADRLALDVDRLAGFRLWDGRMCNDFGTQSGAQ